MSADELNAIEAQRQAVLGQLKTAETALQAGMQSKGFGATAREHLERARAHIAEAYIALTEPRQARSVQQLVEDLNHIQQVMDHFHRRPSKSQRV